jgi:hypothetical protein
MNWLFKQKSLRPVLAVFLVWSRRQRMLRDFANDNRIGVIQ